MLFCFIVKITGLPMASKRLAKETGCKSPACHRKPCGKNNPRSPCCEPCGAVHPRWLQYNAGALLGDPTASVYIKIHDDASVYMKTHGRCLSLRFTFSFYMFT